MTYDQYVYHAEFPPLTVTSYMRRSGSHATGNALDLMVSDFGSLRWSPEQKAQIYFDVYFSLAEKLDRSARLDMVRPPGCLHYHIQPANLPEFGLEINRNCSFEGRQPMTLARLETWASNYMQVTYGSPYQRIRLSNLETPSRFSASVHQKEAAADTFAAYFVTSSVADWAAPLAILALTGFAAWYFTRK